MAGRETEIVPVTLARNSTSTGREGGGGGGNDQEKKTKWGYCNWSYLELEEGIVSSSPVGISLHLGETWTAMGITDHLKSSGLNFWYLPP